MRVSKTISRIFIAFAWLVMAGFMVYVFTAASQREQRKKCLGISIHISDAQARSIFINKADIQTMLVKAAGNEIVGQPKDFLQIDYMEKALQANKWIKKGEIYFDNNDLLQVNIIERQPIARVFYAANKSFYLDDSNQRIEADYPIDRLLPIFTDYSNANEDKKRDSILRLDILTLANFITADSFWQNQVSQIDIQYNAQAKQNSFVVIPSVGNHVIYFGSLEDYQRKFNRLLMYYKNVSSAAGIDAYNTLDLSYKGQVVASNSASIPQAEAAVVSNEKVTTPSIKSAEPKKIIVKKKEAKAIKGKENAAKKKVAPTKATSTKAPTKKIAPSKVPVVKKAIEKVDAKGARKPAKPVQKKTDEKKGKAVMPKKAKTNTNNNN